MNPQLSDDRKPSRKSGQDHRATARRLRGLRIAATVRIGQNQLGYIVTSQSRRGAAYLVKLDDTPSCTCPDFELRRKRCKHIWAVLFILGLEEPPVDQPTSERKRRRPSPVRDWSDYNNSQSTTRANFATILRALCDTVPQPPQATGRPRLPLGDVVYAVVLKTFVGISCREFMADVANAHDKGHIRRTPSLASTFRYLEDPSLTPILEELVVRSAYPLRSIESKFAIDASGFSSSPKDNWNEHKWGSQSGIGEWLKAHIACGVETRIVTAAFATPGNANDNPFFRPLLEATGRHFSILEVSADKAYLDQENLKAAEDVGAVALIPFKSNTAPVGEGKDRNPEWERSLRYFEENHEDFLERYHNRSQVECVFSMIKSKFGAVLRAKSQSAQLNEVLTKIICHNVCVVAQATRQLRIEADFGPAAADGPQNLLAA